MSFPFGLAPLKHSKKVPIEPTPDYIFEQVSSEKSQLQSCNYVFDASKWKHFFKKFQNQAVLKKQLRILVQIGTVDAWLRGKYYIFSNENNPKDENGNEVTTKSEESQPISVEINKKRLEEEICSARMFSYEENQLFFKHVAPSSFSWWSVEHTTEIIVAEGDCLDCAVWIKQQNKGNSIAVLDMASSSNPGKKSFFSFFIILNSVVFNRWWMVERFVQNANL